MTLPADLDPRAVLGPDSFSYSELSSLAECENKWALQYTGDRERFPATPSMARGTDIHKQWGAWWTGGNWEDTDDPTVLWLMRRYAQHYATSTLHLEMRQVEPLIWFQHPDGSWFFGYADGLVYDSSTGEYWNAECKSASQLSAAVWLEQQIQQKLYVLAWRSMGVPVVGSMLDVLCTTGADQIEPQADAYKRHRAAGKSTAEANELKRTDRLKVELPLTESFDRRWLRYSDEELNGSLAEAHSAMSRRKDLRSGYLTPMRSVGWSCDRCFVQPQCFNLDVGDVIAADDDAF